MPSQTAGRRRRTTRRRIHRGGAYEIKQEGDKWYVYLDGTKIDKAYNSFADAKAFTEAMMGAVKLIKMKYSDEIPALKGLDKLSKSNGGRRTRRHRRRHH
jgi:hypothetical protein